MHKKKPNLAERMDLSLSTMHIARNGQIFGEMVTLRSKETKVHRAVANAFLALDGHDIFFEKITKDLAFINASGKDKTPRADVENAMKSLKRDVRMCADISKHDSDNARMLTKAGIGIDLMDTGAACRTYNILVAENRRVAAALQV